MKEITIDGVAYKCTPIIGGIEQQLEQDSILSKPKNKPFWEAENSKNGFYIDECGYVVKSKLWFFKAKYRAYETEELAKQANKLDKVKWRVRKRIHNLNYEAERFIQEEDSFSFRLLNDKITVVSGLVVKDYPSWQYLKSKELVNQLIEEMQNDLILIRSE